MMDWIALLGRLLLAVVFLVAAVGKLTDRPGARRALVDFGVPRVMATPAAVILPVVELTVAVLLLPGATARWGAVGALGLLGLFLAAMLVSLARGRKPDCHCFGQLHSAPVSWRTLTRNAALAAVAVLVLWRDGGSPALTAGIGAIAWAAMTVALVAIALAALAAWFVLELLRQQGRLLIRVEKLEAAVGEDRLIGLRVGQQAPEFELRDLTGGRHRLATLRSSGRPVLLFFSNPDCAPCDAVLPELARWQREHAGRVDVAVISYGPVDVNRAKAAQYGLSTVLLQKHREVTEAYDVSGTPAAVLVDADGRIASEMAFGAERIEALLRQAAGGAMLPPLELVPGGDGDGWRQPSAQPALAVGQPVPALVLPDLEGTPTALADRHGSPTLVLFWSPACGFCQQMLPDLKAWERRRPVASPQLLIVSTGTVEANRAMGLASPIVLDADGSAMRAFGASGTPMAVLVDADGRIASDVARGTREVMVLARTQRHGHARSDADQHESPEPVARG